MLLYVAFSLTPDTLERMADRAGARTFLFTFANSGAKKCALHFAKRPDMDLFIDSGAFTAWADGKPIVLREYIKFAKELQDSASCRLTFAALDQIAGTRKNSKNGINPSLAEFEEACEVGWKNYLEMKAHGIKSVPTFHQGDDFKWLDILAGETDHIAVAPRKAGKSDEEKMAWLNQVFRRIRDRGQLRTLRVHGLGVASPLFMQTFPFYSVDSTACQVGQRGCPYTYFDGNRIKPVAKSKWVDMAWKPLPVYDSMIDSSCLEAFHRYRRQSEGSTDGQFGTYWFVEQAIKMEGHLQKYITAHWEYRGVTWNETRVREALQLDDGAVAVVG
jgi:hypothetical protein